MAMQVGRVVEIRRYPVKSMGGEVLERVGITRGGIPGDRAWSVRDEASKSLTGAKKLPALMGLSARYLEDPPETGSGPAQIALPDGSEVLTTAPDVAQQLSVALDHPVSLCALRPADDLDFYRNTLELPADVQGYLREVFARTPDEPLPDLAKFPPEIFQYSSPPGTFFDAFPLLLMTSNSLAHLSAAASESNFDVRRFRPNFMIEAEGGEAGFPENAWAGKRLRIGGAVVGVTIECPRCVMTTHGFEDLPKDPKVMRHLVKEAGGNLGVYATVEQSGSVSVGDAVELAED